MRDVEQQDSETSGLLNKQASADEKPKRRAVALTIVVALVAATALVNLVPGGRGGGLRATRLESGAAAPYGAQSAAYYFPDLGASLVVAANNELKGPEYHEDIQVSYVYCLAIFAAYNVLHGENIQLREECQRDGGGPANGFDLYRDQNLRKASN